VTAAFVGVRPWDGTDIYINPEITQGFGLSDTLGAPEQTYVIEGSLEDHEGKCGPGQIVWRPAGNQHEAVAPNGAVLLGFFLKPNRFAYGEKFFTAAGERESVCS